MPTPWAPSWSQTIANMLAEPQARVWRHCSRCGLHKEVTKEEIAALIRNPQFGPLYSLWNRRPKPCLTPDCESDNFYMSSQMPGQMVSPMTSDDRMIPKLHRRWALSRNCLINCCSDAH